ncbi:halocyanin domain-containing protein [Halomicroarcula sp. S1AR25-4]|uniref:halocyanin domain-containing protein n=1 Tax=Haloarcula sp. S1AR25-4 TaxID=2950538 RepID=UPI0028748FF4|nr:halocyanin domain-containing protein [Halomicroarcula sp. S1AR25-4]MDS0276889.1 halocyanin domain-containing protein [Halomicroarcula sp. S1AR25-4]
MTDHLDRRTFIQSTAAVSGAGLLAGCGGSGGDSGGSDGESGGDSGGTETADSTPTDTEDGSGGDVPSDVSDYLSDVGNFDGTVADETGTGNVEVTVGAEGNGGAYAFAPAAVRIDAGTDVNWSWTGEGGSHNVVHEEGEFESDLVTESGNDFQHTFESAGVYLYYCQPHKSLGMKGAIIVE